MQIFEKGCLNNVLFQQDRAESLHFIVVVQVGLPGSKVSTGGLAEAVI